MVNNKILAFTCHRCNKQVSYVSTVTVQSGARYNLCDECLDDLFGFMDGGAVVETIEAGTDLDTVETPGTYEFDENYNIDVSSLPSLTMFDMLLNSINNISKASAMAEPDLNELYVRIQKIENIIMDAYKTDKIYNREYKALFCCHLYCP